MSSFQFFQPQTVQKAPKTKEIGKMNEDRWYDTREGIIESLRSLESFNRLIDERHTAGYERREQLNEFYILGYYNLDTCGNCLGAKQTIPKEMFPSIPDVLTRDEFWTFIKANKPGPEEMWLSFASGVRPAPADVVCAHCHRSWSMQNCSDVVQGHQTDVFPLTEFVGQTLHEVKASYAQRKDPNIGAQTATYRMQSDITIRNDQHIDLSPKYPNPEKDWQRGIIKNERGWLGEREGLTDDYVIQPGDEGFFNIWTFRHCTCKREHLRLEEEASFRQLFEAAGFTEFQMEAVPNEYCSCLHCAPWFKVHTSLGVIKNGWRKRVINIDWSGLKGRGGKQAISTLFTQEDVTQDTAYIHAWGTEKAQDYLSRIRQLLTQ